jgi:Tfp pilus assembly protein PilV
MVVEATGKAAASAIEAMKSTPLAIALLIVNVGFLGFAAYVLGEVAANASERNKAQIELITSLVGNIRDCRQGPGRS